MKLKHLSLAVAGGVVLTSAGAFALAAAGQDPPMPEPAEQHEHLMGAVGTWDCAMTMWGGPGEPMTGTGVEVCRAIGDFHVVSDFTSEMMGMPFEGHGISSWDPTKQKYVSIWVDSFEPTPAVLEGTYDEATHALTFTGDAMMMGQRMKTRQVVTVKDADHRTFDMYVTPPGGDEMQTMHLEYTRRK